MIFFLVRLVRVLFVLFVVRLGLRFVAEMIRPSVARPSKPSDLELVRDRVCNTFVPRARALTALVAGREEYFCSAACRDRASAQIARA